MPSPLFTDAAIVRTGGGDRAVYPLYPDETPRGPGWGPDDRFIDAFELGDGTAWLAFERRDYEARSLRLVRLTPSGDSFADFVVGLYGC